MSAIVFESNRHDLLVQLGIPARIEEQHVPIESFVIIDKDGTATVIEQKPGNMFGRFFIGFVATLAHPDSQPTEFHWTSERKALTAAIFAENWDDKFTAEDGRGRQMLKALSSAERIERIKWKS